jgi:predicted DNA-binding transcriptional regulator YafY
MSKSTWFFEIIQMLRAAKAPLLARDMAETLEVSPRTIYRDIATLQSMQTPILGEPGIGYVMRKGYDLPPINLDVEEAEAIAVGLAMIARTGDAGLMRAAGRASRKLNAVAPTTRQLIASSWGVGDGVLVDMTLIRAAMRDEQKLVMQYRDASDAETTRVIWPLALIYYSDSAMIVAWCELRKGLRHFRLDRMLSVQGGVGGFIGQGTVLLAEWEQTQKAATVDTVAL